MTLRQEAAALRDFDPAYVRLGSTADKPSSSGLVRFTPEADIGLTPAAGSRPQLRLPSRFETRQLRSGAWRQSSVTDLTTRCSRFHTPCLETG